MSFERRWKSLLILSAITLASAAVANLLGRARLFQIIHLKAQGWRFQARGDVAAPGILLVTVDGKSLDEIPEPLIFWHGHYAKVIQAAVDGGARTVGLGVAFAIPVGEWTREDYDGMLLQAVRRASSKAPVICAYKANGVTPRFWQVDLNNWTRGHRQLAYSNLYTDPDDFIRRFEVIGAPPAASGMARSFALRITESFLGAEAKWENDRLILAGNAIPIAADRTLAINYPGRPGVFPRVSFSDFLAAAASGQSQQIAEWVSGKIVLIGTDTIEDRLATPFYSLTGIGQPGSRANTASIEAQAAAIHTLLERRYLQLVPEWARSSAMIAGAAATAVLASALGMSGVAFSLLAIALMSFIATHLLFEAGWILSSSELILSGGLALVGTLVYRNVSAEQLGHIFERAMSVFVDTGVAARLRAERRISMQGSSQVATILFSDIRGFTRFCDGKDPAEVVALLNEYFETMVAIIDKRHGRANKFIGDGILAIFSEGEHARLAVECGLEMVRQPGRFQTGAGIHTGMVVLGNVGSSKKMEYTALGETVNVASRLEGLNKECKTKLLMSEETRKRLPDSLKTVCLGSRKVSGMDEPVTVYTLEALEP
jgi:adenylate cyclase